MGCLGELAAVSNDDGHLGLAAVAAIALNLFHNLQCHTHKAELETSLSCRPGYKEVRGCALSIAVVCIQSTVGKLARRLMSGRLKTTKQTATGPIEDSAG